jgi:hypothetical protein
MEQLERIITLLKANRETLYIILFFILLGYFYLGADYLAHQSVAPMDLLLHYQGWSNVGINLPITDLERSDIVDALIPQWNFARDALLHGIVPLWIPYTAGGTPSITLLSNSLITPSFLVFLIFGGGLGFSLALLVKILIGSIGTYKLCRTELGILPSLFGGITFMMCGFNASWLMWPHVSTSIWIPWLLWGLILLNKEPSKLRFFIVAFVVALLIFGGFPFVTAVAMMLGSVFIVWLMYVNHRNSELKIKLKSIFISFSAMICGVFLSFVQLLPFIEYTLQVDTSWRSGGSIFTLNDLDILWTPFKYTHLFGDNIVPQVEKCGAVGIITLVLSIIAIVYIIKWREKRLSPLSPVFWGALSLALFIPVFNILPLSSIIYQIPVFNSSSNSRLLVFLGLTFSILGAYGFNIIRENSERKSSNNSFFRMGFAVLFVLIIFIQIVDLSAISRSQNAIVPAESFYPETPTIAFVQHHIEPGQSVLTTSSFLVSGTITYYNIADWFAHNYHKNEEKKILNEVVSDAWVTHTAAMYQFKQINLNSSFMDTLGIRYVLTSNTTPFTGINQDQWKIISVEPGISLFENLDCPSGAYLLDDGRNIEKSSQDDITLLTSTANYRRYSVTSSHGATFVTTIRYWPGWEASVNRKPVQIEPYLGIIQSIQISEGNSIVEFVYVPYLFYGGLLISIITGIFLILLPKRNFLL